MISNKQLEWMGILTLFCATIFIKDYRKVSPAMKEFYAKHYSMLFCLHGYLLMQPTAYFQKEKDDVFVMTFGRSGTMIMVNMVHQLRTGGDRRFSDIMAVGQHFVELSGLGDPKTMNLPQKGGPPRIFWTHGFWWNLPSPPRGIYVIRNPVDVVRSWHYFTEQFYQMKNKLTIEDFFYDCFMYNCFWPAEPYWHNVATWWQFGIEKAAANNPDAQLAWFHFENLLGTRSKTEQTVDVVARFVNITYSEQKSRILRSYMTRQFFERHQKKFSIRTLQYAAGKIINTCMTEPAYRLAIDIPNLGVKSIHVGGKNMSKKVVPDEILRIMDNKWTEIVEPETGYADYAKMLENSRNHIFFNKEMFTRNDDDDDL